jgi:hypothetical protein
MQQMTSFITEAGNAVEAKVKVPMMNYSEVLNKHLCPECGGVMSEVARVNENGFAFIWYECSQANCDGQWLEKLTAGTIGN